MSVFENTRAEKNLDALLREIAFPGTFRVRRIKAWMLIAPVDLLAVTSPLVIQPSHWKAFVTLGLLCVVLLYSGGRYRARLHLSTLDDIPTIVGRVFVAIAIVASIIALRHPSEQLAVFLRWSVLSAVVLVLGRCFTSGIILAARKRRLVLHSTVLIGAGAVGAEILRLLRAYPRYGLCISSIVDDPARRITAGEGTPPLPVHSIEELDNEVRRVQAKVILIADSAYTEDGLLDHVRQPASSRCDLMVVPRLHDFHTQAGLVDHIGAIPIMRISSPALLGRTRVTKRIFDIVVTSAALIVAAPLMALAAIAVLADGRGGVLFRQTRITRDGRTFELLKFRTMRPDTNGESLQEWSMDDNVRVTKVGRLLRRTSVDELPQLWNILRGDMTLVGPRPERPYFVEQFSAADPRYARRHRVVCGLTGLAQVSGLRGDTSISDRARFDNFYIENWSLWMDVKVLIRTFAEVVGGKGR